VTDTAPALVCEQEGFFRLYLIEDHKIRKFIRKEAFAAIPRVEIERTMVRYRVRAHGRAPVR
jgi:ribosomal protein S3